MTGAFQIHLVIKACVSRGCEILTYFLKIKHIFNDHKNYYRMSAENSEKFDLKTLFHQYRRVIAFFHLFLTHYFGSY